MIARAGLVTTAQVVTIMITVLVPIRVAGSRYQATVPHEPSEPAARLPTGNFQGKASFIADHRLGALRCRAPAETSTV